MRHGADEAALGKTSRASCRGPQTRSVGGRNPARWVTASLATDGLTLSELCQNGNQYPPQVADRDLSREFEKRYRRRLLLLPLPDAGIFASCPETSPPPPLASQTRVALFCETAVAFPHFFWIIRRLSPSSACLKSSLSGDSTPPRCRGITLHAIRVHRILSRCKQR